ncbi:MAG: hypothetical protein M1820_007809 [Bogoriella megaspora]|nr:MAG: hypothetical protein M1820_007809 [Bogoriella megaspora]
MATQVLVIGAGAVGAFYGSRLALASDAKVAVVCRSNYNAVQEDGFSVTSSQFGSYIWKPSQVFSSPDEARKCQTTWDYIVVSTKALPDVGDDSALLEGLVGDSTSIVLIQNGLGVEEPYNKRFPYAPILSAVTIVSTAQPTPGHIQHNRWTRINIGPYLPLSSSQNSSLFTSRNTQFVDLLQAGGVKDAILDTHARLQLVRWHKLAINAAFNPSSVLAGGVSNNTMATDPELSRHIEAVMQEVFDTAPKVIGQAFPAGFPSVEQILKSTRKNTSGSRPSMWADWKNGRPLEIEVILGNPIRIAREKGLEMPRLQSVYALVKKAQENRDARRKSKGENKL